MKKLVRLLPSHLNLNGDAANCDALSFYLGSAGVDTQILDFNLDDQWDERVDFVVVGHGSIAAWKSLASHKTRIADFLIRARISGAIILLVSSAISELSADLKLNLIPEKTDRVSKFVEVEFKQLKLVGYVNTDLELPYFESRDGFWLTSLHGPLVAKNPELVNEWFQINPKLGDQVSRALAEARGLATQLADE